MPSHAYSIVSLRKRVATRGSFEAVRKRHHTGAARFTKHLQLKDTESGEGLQTWLVPAGKFSGSRRDYAD